MSSVMEKPVLFIKEDKLGKFNITPEATAVLKAVDKPIVVVATAGKYRTGKSYLMNQLYGKSRGFDLGPTVQACTKGFWIWCRPHPHDPNKWLVLLDTEGLDDVQQDSTHDVKVFSLAILLSSCLVYNSQGTIDNDAINKLHFVTKLTEHIKVQSDAEEESGSNFDRYFPSFVWVVRDFTLALEIDGEKCTPDDYLDHALTLKKGLSEEIDNFNYPRECIRDFFPERKCFVLCSPVHDTAKLQRLEEVSLTELKPGFTEGMQVLREFIHNKAKPFEQFEASINGERFLFLAEKYLKAINDGVVPCIGNAFQMMKDHECSKAVSKAVDKFKQEMEMGISHGLPISLEDFSSLTREATDLAITVYHQEALFDESGIFHQKLLDDIEKENKRYVENNETKSTDRCNQILEELTHTIEQKIQEGRYSRPGGYTEYTHDYELLVVKYGDAVNKGPRAKEVLDCFMEQRRQMTNIILDNDKALSDKEKRIADTQEQLKQEERSRQAKHEEAQRLQQEVIDNNINYQQLMKREKDEFEKRVEKLKAKNSQTLETREAEHKRLLEEGLLSQAKLYEEAVNEARAAEKTLKEEYLKRSVQIQEDIERQNKLIEDIRQNSEKRQKQNNILKFIGYVGITGLQCYLTGPVGGAIAGLNLLQHL